MQAEWEDKIYHSAIVVYKHDDGSARRPSSSWQPPAPQRFERRVFPTPEAERVGGDGRDGRLMLGLNKRWGYSHLIWSTIHLTPSIVEGERDEVNGELVCNTNNIKTYSKALPFQKVRHDKVVLDNSFNLPKGWLKAIVGYQQNRRQEFEESEDEYELYFKLHTLTYDVRYLSQEFGGWKMAGGVNGMWQHSVWSVTWRRTTITRLMIRRREHPAIPYSVCLWVPT